MKRVEPFILDVAPPVLEYAPPDPPLSAMDRLRELLDLAVDFVGGPSAALVICIIFCIGVGASISGPVGAVLIMTGGVLIRVFLHQWVRSSRW